MASGFASVEGYLAIIADHQWDKEAVIIGSMYIFALLVSVVLWYRHAHVRVHK